MASKKAGRAAGLAALAGLAYMASRDKQGSKAASNLEQDEATSPRDRMPASSAAADDFDVSGEGGYNAPADMSRVERSGTPAVATRSAAPAKVAADISTQSQRYPSADSPVLSSGAGSGGPRVVGLGRSAGRGGAEAGEEAAYNAAKQSQALKNFSTKSPGIMARMREKDKAMMDDGGKSMVDRQNAGAQKAGLNVDDYYTSGKAQIDKQEGTFKRGGKVKKMASGGMTSSVSSASRRGDGIATKGKTRCKMY
jgi:hypothetical protein